MNTKVLGVSLGTVLMVVIVAVIAKKFGAQIPLLNRV